MVDRELERLGLPRLSRQMEVPEFKHACLGGVYALKSALRYVAFIGENTDNWALTSAAGAIVVVPVMLLFLFMQERFIQGMASGGLKF